MKLPTYIQFVTALFVFAILQANVHGQETAPPKIPQADSPTLKLLFSDDFKKDSRGDYEIEGISDWRKRADCMLAAVLHATALDLDELPDNSATWELGKLKLEKGVGVRREIDAGNWIELDLKFEFPKSNKGKVPPALKIVLKQKGLPTCHVVSITGSTGETKGQIAIYDGSETC